MKIQKRCTTGTFKEKETPFGRFFNTEVDLKVVKPFVCVELVNIPLENLTKLDITAERGILVGLAEGLLSYRLYCGAKKRIVHVH